MPNLSPVDQQLLAVVNAASSLAGIPPVIATMKGIDSLLPNNDGLKWFNRLYLTVTQAIDLQSQTAWASAAWLTRLDVVFAGLYFTAISDFLNQSQSTPSAWNALFESRDISGIDRIQFALAGMNAHINHDLALALIQADTEMNLQPSLQSPEHADYERVNNILAQVMPAALNELAVGVLGEAAQDTGKIGRLLAIWNITVARDTAWAFADYLRVMPAALRPQALALQDKTTGLVGRSLLLPV